MTYYTDRTGQEVSIKFDWNYAQFGSWTYSGQFIDLDMDLTNLNSGSNDTKSSSTPIRDKNDPQNYFVHDAIDRTYYIINGEWSLISELY